MKKLLGNDTAAGIALAAIALIVYLKTLSPSVQIEDCGEIATALYTLGIVHPTGYPLFTLVGWAFSHLPLGGTVIWKLNLLVALLCSLAVFLFYRLFVFVLSDRSPFPGGTSLAERRPAGPPEQFPSSSSSSTQTQTPTQTDPLFNRIAAATATLILAFSRTFWSEALSLEVYAFHLVLLAAVTGLFLRALSERRDGSNRAANRWWYLFALALGLGFSNHMMIGLLGPAFLYLYFATHGFGRAAWAKIGRGVLPFLAGLSVYLYLPLSAARGPLMDWGDPIGFGNFWRHVSAAQYRFRMYSSWEVPARKIPGFFAAFPSEFGYAPLLLMLLGLAAMLRRDRRMLAFSLLFFFGCLFYSANYDFDDPDFYLNAYFAACLWALYGARALLDAAHGRRRVGAAVILCGALAIVPLWANYGTADESRDYAVEDYVKNALGSLEPNAVLLTSETRALTLPAYYYQIVEKFRPDVVVLDYKLLGMPWYYAEIERRHPEIIAASRPEVDAFLKDARGFDESGSSDARPMALQFLWTVRGILRKSGETRPVYVTADIRPEYTEGFEIAPSGLAFRLYPGAPSGVSIRDFSYRPIVRNTPGDQEIREFYAGARVNQGLYVALEQDKARGLAMIRSALEIAPDFPPALEWLRKLEAAP